VKRYIDFVLKHPALLAALVVVFFLPWPMFRCHPTARHFAQPGAIAATWP
jgi:hypothetical protein